MELLYSIEFDIAGIILLGILCFIFKNQYALNSQSNRIFLMFASSCLICGILDVVTAFTISYAAVVPVILNLILNTLYLISSVLSAFLVNHYIRVRVSDKSKIRSIICFSIVGIYFFLLIVNFFTGIIFSFKDGNYIHGPLFLLNFFIPILFLISVGYLLLVFRNSFTKKQLKLITSVFMFPLIASLVQIMFPTYLLTFFSYALFTFMVMFSIETPDFIELAYLRENLEKEVAKQTAKSHERQRKIELMSIEATQALATAIDEKDDYTNGHSIRVSAYSVLLAQGLDWDQDKIERLRLAALLHDIGKIGIPDVILKNPNKLSEDEYEIVKTHTTKGGKILHNLTTLPDAEIVALYHHERYDGKGYPGKFIGKEIPEFARVVNITDAYDAMTSKRIYRDKLPKEEVIRRMKENSGSQFDPDYLIIFLNLVDCGII